MAPPVPASMVLTATTAMRRSVPASVEPGLKPNQPKARMNVPSSAIGMWWPGIGDRLAVLRVLADARAEHHRPGQRGHAPHQVHDRGAGEVDVAVAEAEVHAEVRRASRRPRPSCAKSG